MYGKALPPDLLQLQPCPLLHCLVFLLEAGPKKGVQ